MGKVVFIVAALIYVFSKIDLQRMFAVFSHANYFLLFLAMLLFFFSKVISAWRHQLLLHTAHVRLSSWLNYKLYWLGMFYNLFFPGGIGGDGYKVWWLQKNFEVKTKPMVGALLLDRLSGMHAVLVLIIMFFVFIPQVIPYQQFVFLLIPIAYIALWFVITWFFGLYKNVFFRIAILSLCLQGAQLFAAFLMLEAFGVSGSYVAYLFVFLISSLAIVLPISIGGVGLRELVFLYGATLFALNSEISIALSLSVYVISIIISIPGVYSVFRAPTLTD